jgi:hypothetical protein
VVVPSFGGAWANGYGSPEIFEIQALLYPTTLLYGSIGIVASSAMDLNLSAAGSYSFNFARYSSFSSSPISGGINGDTLPAFKII